MKPTKTEIVSPTPYFEISFGCSNRQFYQVKRKIYEIGIKLGIDPSDGYISEKCDYEGDLEELRVYREDRSKLFVDEILKHYDVNDKIPDDMDIVLSI